jgi:hypothetical protein
MLTTIEMALHLLVADHHLIGTAFGGKSRLLLFNDAYVSLAGLLQRWKHYHGKSGAEGLILMIQEVTFGKIQDGTPGGGYFRVLNLALGLKAAAFFIALVYIIVDYQYLGKGLTMTRQQRDVVENDIRAQSRQDIDPVTKRQAVRGVTNSGLALLGALLVTAWVLFFMGLA